MGGVQPDKQRERRNKRVGIVMGGVALGMVGMGFASVPLYRLFCQVTGLNGTVSRAEASELDFSQAVKGQTIQVRFDANHRDDLPWDFKPEQTTDTATIGALANISPKSSVSASPSRRCSPASKSGCR
jgi:cytochrome c oxidase assembly protein subunit 11